MSKVLTNIKKIGEYVLGFISILLAIAFARLFGLAGVFAFFVFIATSFFLYNKLEPKSVIGTIGLWVAGLSIGVITYMLIVFFIFSI